jgi:undecaprenyl-diphosphatase
MGLMKALDHALESAGRRHPAGTAAKSLARLCSPPAAIAQGIAAALALRRQGRPATPALLAVPVAIGAGKALKRLVRRPRPLWTRLSRKGQQSFPSTHVAGPVALLVCLGWIAPRGFRWGSVLALGSSLVAAVAVERICAGAHWPSDVAGGAVLGAMVGTALGLPRRRGESRA